MENSPGFFSLEWIETTMDIKQHLPHLAAAPVAVAVVSHTYGGLGFEPVALSVAVSASLTVGVWSAWSHVFAPRVGALVRSVGLVAAIALSGAEGYLMYQYKGDSVDPGYTAAMANYNLQESRYQQELADWQSNQKAVVSSIKAQQQEIIDTDKLTSRRADMDRLTQQLAKATAQQPPVFGLERPVERRTTNLAWLAVTAATIGLTPVLYGVFHLFGWRRRDREELQASKQVATVVDQVSEPARKPATLADVLAVQALPVGASFACPVCGASAIRKQKRTVTCSSNNCRATVSRLRKAAKTDNVVTLRRAS